MARCESTEGRYCKARRTEPGSGPILAPGLGDGSRSAREVRGGSGAAGPGRARGRGSGTGTGTCPELTAPRLGPPVRERCFTVAERLRPYVRVSPVCGARRTLGKRRFVPWGSGAMRAPGETRPPPGAVRAPAPFPPPGGQRRSPLAGSRLCGERSAFSAHLGPPPPGYPRCPEPCGTAGPALPSPAGGSRRRAPPEAAKTGSPVPSRRGRRAARGSGERLPLGSSRRLSARHHLRSDAPRPLRRCAAGLPDVQVLSALRPRHLGAAPTPRRGVSGRDRVPPSRGSPGGGVCPRDDQCSPLLRVPPQRPGQRILRRQPLIGRGEEVGRWTRGKGDVAF